MRSLTLKLVLAFLLVILLGTLLVAALGQRTARQELGHFMMGQDRERLVARLADHYRQHGGWEGVSDLLAGRPGGMRGPGPLGALRPGFLLADPEGRLIAPGGDQLPAASLAGGTPIRLEGRVVGVLVDPRQPLPLGGATADVVGRVNRGLLLAAGGASLAALLVAVGLAEALTRPVRELTEASRAVAAGELGRQVPVRSADELGQLARSFNHMSLELRQADKSRRQMTADIAHELRTPLSVILGHSEALAEGVLEPTPQRLGQIHGEALRLSRLVEDLRTLSLADARHLTLSRRAAEPGHLLERARASHEARARAKGIELRAQVEASLPLLQVDPERMDQVLGNLVENALRHTPSGGVVTLRAQAVDGGVRLSVRDTGSGISPQDRERIFERFYRVDPSRRRDEEVSGLGLAIARSLVEAHGGRIWVESRPGQGAEFLIELPAAR